MDDFTICKHCGTRTHRLTAHERRCAEYIDAAVKELHTSLATIPHLTVHGVGTAGDELIVYCRAKYNAQKRIPKEHAGLAVKYVLCAAIPAGAK